MRLSDTGASVLLTDDGRAILAAGGGAEPGPLTWLEVDVVESEDLGIWVRVERAGQLRILLLRWEYILAVDVESGRGRPIGMRS